MSRKVIVTIDPLTDVTVTELAHQAGCSKAEIIQAIATLAAMQESHDNIVHFAQQARNGKRAWKRKNT